VERTSIAPPAGECKPEAGKVQEATKQKPPEAQVAPDIVSRDRVIIRGGPSSARPASRAKDALTRATRPLDLQGADRAHSLFSGTRLFRASKGRRGCAAVAAAGAGDTDVASQVSPTPEGGCLAYMVRTGFNSSQGEPLQMIEFSQEKAQGDTRKMLLALLCCWFLPSRLPAMCSRPGSRRVRRRRTGGSSSASSF